MNDVVISMLYLKYLIQIHTIILLKPECVFAIFIITYFSVFMKILHVVEGGKLPMEKGLERRKLSKKGKRNKNKKQKLCKFHNELHELF